MWNSFPHTEKKVNIQGCYSQLKKNEIRTYRYEKADFRH
jgi:hypothetical protein